MSQIEPPAEGWLRATRDRIGLSGSAVADRMGATRQLVSSLEKSERERTIRLDSLDRYAEAIGYRVRYWLEPVDAEQDTSQPPTNESGPAELLNPLTTISALGRRLGRLRPSDR